MNITKKITLLILLVFILPGITYAQKKESVTSGHLDIVKLSSPEFDGGKERPVRIWIPDGFSDENAAGVIYMQDGQNLFDNATAFAGEWKVDESLAAFILKNNTFYIVVGIDNGPNRSNEYSPHWPGVTTSTSKITNNFVKNPEGDTYLSFLTDTVKPYVDKNYNTIPGKEFTYIAGSSMGGVISLYCAMERPDIFKGAIVLSPALHVYKAGSFEKYVKEKAKEYNKSGTERPKLYLYTGALKGGSNGDEPWAENCIEGATEKLYKTLIKNGWNIENVTLSKNTSASHQEYFWAKEFPNAIKWMLSSSCE